MFKEVCFPEHWAPPPRLRNNFFASDPPRKLPLAPVPQKTHMIGLLPSAPDHETDFAASPSTAQCRGAGGSHGSRPSLRGRLQGRRLTCPAKPAELSADNRWRTAASNIRPPDGRRHDRPDASHALRNGIASGPKRGSPANAIPVPESESPQTPFGPGAAGDRLRCARRKKSFMPNGPHPNKEQLHLERFSLRWNRTT